MTTIEYDFATFDNILKEASIEAIVRKENDKLATKQMTDKIQEHVVSQLNTVKCEIDDKLKDPNSEFIQDIVDHGFGIIAVDPINEYWRNECWRENNIARKIWIEQLTCVYGEHFAITEIYGLYTKIGNKIGIQFSLKDNVPFDNVLQEGTKISLIRKEHKKKQEELRIRQMEEAVMYNINQKIIDIDNQLCDLNSKFIKDIAYYGSHIIHVYCVTVTGAITTVNSADYHRETDLWLEKLNKKYGKRFSVSESGFSSACKNEPGSKLHIGFTLIK